MASYREFTYNPLKDSTYMSPTMKRYFHDRLNQKLKDLLEEEHLLSKSLLENANHEPDFIDQSAMEELRFNGHAYQKHETCLRREVEAALHRLADNTYGYCVATGKPIGVERLLAAPYVAYCVDIQAEKECHRQSQWA